MALVEFVVKGIIFGSIRVLKINSEEVLLEMDLLNYFTVDIEPSGTIILYNKSDSRNTP